MPTGPFGRSPEGDLMIDVGDPEIVKVPKLVTSSRKVPKMNAALGTGIGLVGVAAGIATFNAVGGSGWKPWAAGLAVGFAAQFAINMLAPQIFPSGAPAIQSGGDSREP